MPDEEALESMDEYMERKHPYLSDASAEVRDRVRKIMITVGDVPEHLREHYPHGYNERLADQAKMRQQMRLQNKKTKPYRKEESTDEPT